MATLYGRIVEIEDDGAPVRGRIVTTGEPSYWVKVLLADGTHRMVPAADVRLEWETVTPPPVAL